MSSGFKAGVDQKEISATQTRIENRRFFDILGISSGFCYCAAQKVYIFGKSCGPQANLGWSPLV
jgi:hypothetical protein